MDVDSVDLVENCRMWVEKSSLVNVDQAALFFMVNKVNVDQ